MNPKESYYLRRQKTDQKTKDIILTLKKKKQRMNIEPRWHN